MLIERMICMKMDALQLSEYIIRRASERGQFVTNLKLQKTLYYVQGYLLRVYPEAAFNDEICHWQYGPVVPRVYFAYSPYGSSPLNSDETTNLPKVEKSIKQLIDCVIDECLKHSARELVTKTHEEAPWEETEPNQVITQDSITKYFCKNNPLDLGEKIVG